MFKRQSPVHKKKKHASHKKRRISPETRVIIVQCVVGFVVLLSVALLVTGVWYGTRIESLTITKVEARGGETIDSGAVANAALTALEGEYLKIIPKRFAWWYPHDAVIEVIKTIPRVKDPVVTRVSGSELLVTYDEYVPAALWCEKESHETCYFVDSTGYAFAAAPALTGSALGRYISTDTKPEMYKTAPFGTDIARIEEWLTELEQVTPLAAESIEVDMMRDVFVTVAGGGEIKFSLQDNLDTVLENVTSILAADSFSTIAPGTFQYVDLRFGNKVFYKNKTN